MDNRFCERAIFAARRYAEFDRSDPFVFRRAMTHINNGIVGFLRDGCDAMYDAVPYDETRVLPDGREYVVTVYRDARRV